jgi:hypothetical protein
MLSILSRIPELLGEGVMFGSGVVGRAVASCLQAAGGQAASEEAWLAWAGREPVELVWLTTAYRYRLAVPHRYRLAMSHMTRLAMPHMTRPAMPHRNRWREF